MIGDQVRDFDGYKQIKFAGQKRWKFVIYSFHMGSPRCMVAKWPNDCEEVLIDDKNRITINGKKYGITNWFH